METLTVLSYFFIGMAFVAMIVKAASFNRRRLSWWSIASVVLMAVGFTALGVISVTKGAYWVAAINAFIAVIDVGWVISMVTELIGRLEESEALLRITELRLRSVEEQLSQKFK